MLLIFFTVQYTTVDETLNRACKFQVFLIYTTDISDIHGQSGTEVVVHFHP
jgi:hypothetical protein